MSRKENPQFTPKEESEIEKYAVAISEQGRESLDDLRDKRNLLMRTQYILFHAAKRYPSYTEDGLKLEHEVDVVNEVLRRAETKMKKAGTDAEGQAREMIVGHMVNKALRDDSI